MQIEFSLLKAWILWYLSWTNCENKHRGCVAVGPQKLKTQLPTGIIQTHGIIRILQTSW